MGAWKVYEPLTTQTVVQYVVDKGVVEKEDVFTVREIGDGNLNLVFHVVKEGERTGIIVKQALPYAKVVGESWPLTLLRATIESNALTLHRKYATDLVPEVLLHDTILATIVMEDLSDMTIYRKALIDGSDYPHTADHIGRYIAHTHFYTSDFYVDEATKKRNVQTFYNPELCKITEDLVYTDPFYDAPTNAFESALKPDVENLWNDEELLFHTAGLKWSFMNEAVTLVHGDLHTGSIFATQERTQVIDPEFAFYGPLGFDLGQFVANLIMQAYTRPEEKRAYLFESIRTVVTTFETEFAALHAQHARAPFASEAFLKATLKRAWRNAVGVCGCEIIRRSIGLAHVADVETLEESERVRVKRELLALGRTCIVGRIELTDVEALLAVVSGQKVGV